MTNLDDHMEEHLNLKAQEEARLAAEKETQQEFENMHHRANQDNERFDNIAKRRPIMKAIVAALTKDSWINTLAVQRRQPAVCYDEADETLIIAGVKASYGLISIDDETISGGFSRYSHRPTGRKRVVVGSYGERKVYPPLKTGGHSYEKIAKEIGDRIGNMIARATSEGQTQINRRLADGLKAELEMRSYSSVIEPTADANRPVYFKYTIGGSMTADQVREMVKKLRDMGFEVKG